MHLARVSRVNGPQDFIRAVPRPRLSVRNYSCNPTIKAIYVWRGHHIHGNAVALALDRIRNALKIRQYSKAPVFGGN